MLITPCSKTIPCSKGLTKEEVKQYFPGFLALVDCTEQPIPRPKKNRIINDVFKNKLRKYDSI
jgi:hypothetical protein